MYYFTSEIGTTSLQGTKLLAPKCPLFGGSTVYYIRKLQSMVRCLQILFVPVMSHSQAVLPEMYVIQFELEAKISNKTIYTIDKDVEGERKQMCYFRYGKTNVEVSDETELYLQ